MLVAPAIAGVAVGVGVPILLAYIYGVVPVSLCQNGVCGVSASPLGVRIDFDDDEDVIGGAAVAGVSGVSGVGSAVGGTGVGAGSGVGSGRSGSGGDLSAIDGNDNGSVDGPTAYFSRGGAAGVGVGQSKQNNTDAVSLDANNLGLVGNPSIGTSFHFSVYSTHTHTQDQLAPLIKSLVIQSTPINSDATFFSDPASKSSASSS